MDIPFSVFSDIMRSAYARSVKAGLEGHIQDALVSFDNDIATMHHTLKCGEYVEFETLDEIKALMGDDFAAFEEGGCIGLVMCSLSLHDEPVFEAGKMEMESGDQKDAEALLKDLPTPILRSFARATIKVMRAHGLAQDTNKAESPSGVGLLGEMFAELMSEVIEEEINDKVKAFSLELAGMLSVEPIVGHSWKPPEGGARNDLPHPG